MTNNELNDIIKVYDQLINFETYLQVMLPTLQKQKTGQGTFKICCPLHEENTPSFLYNDAMKIWTCFGTCNTSGKVTKFHRLWLKKSTGNDHTIQQVLKDLYLTFQHLNIPYYRPEKKYNIKYQEEELLSSLEQVLKTNKIKIIPNNNDINKTLLKGFIGSYKLNKEVNNI